MSIDVRAGVHRAIRTGMDLVPDTMAVVAMCTPHERLPHRSIAWTAAAKVDGPEPEGKNSGTWAPCD